MMLTTDNGPGFIDRRPRAPAGRRCWLPAWLLAAPIVLGLSSGQGLALHIGLTPSQVFGLWTNINDSLVAVARVVSPDKVWRKRLLTMRPRKFAGKKPADVLALVDRYRAKLDALRRRDGLPSIDHRQYHGHTVTPSVVYISSGRVLNGQVEWLIRRTDRGQLISQFYRHHKFRGKVPSHVYGLVDLANRRLDAILAKAGVAPPGKR